MDGYVNNITLVEGEISQILVLSVTCPLCQNILIDPVICKCKKIYCKACIDDWSKKNKKCPNNCKKPNYQKYTGNYEVLSKLKFRCLGCQKEILYFDAKSHHKSCCPDKKITKLKKVDQKEVSEMRKLNSDNVRTINGKKKHNIIFYIVITLGDSGVGKSSLIQT